MAAVGYRSRRFSPHPDRTRPTARCTGATCNVISGVRRACGQPVHVVGTGGQVIGTALSPDGATPYAILSDRLLAIDVSRYT